MRGRLWVRAVDVTNTAQIREVPTPPGLSSGASTSYGLAARHGLTDPSPAAMARVPLVLKIVAWGVEAGNRVLSRVEQIKKFNLIEREWEAGRDEPTPTMKLKRKPIAEKYAHEIEALYAE